jgi:hypothetical protein
MFVYEEDIKFYPWSSVEFSESKPLLLTTNGYRT